GGGTETAAGSNQSPGTWRNFPLAVEKTGQGRRLWNGRCRSWSKASRAAERIAAERWRHAFIRQERTGHRAGRRAQQGRDGKQSADARHREGIKGFGR